MRLAPIPKGSSKKKELSTANPAVRAKREANFRVIFKHKRREDESGRD